MQEFNQLAESVFGWGWQSKLACAFKINVRTVRRWAAGDSKVPHRIMEALVIMKKEGIK
jgi:DNA-binding transcriptional regulator YiaG